MSDDALRWLFSLERLGMKFGLENMSSLMTALGEPHRAFATIHVAGTNGKGSVTAMLDTALRKAGYRSARYTSPHLVRLEERFVIDGREVETEALASAAERIRLAVEGLLTRGVLTAPPTFFEVTTATAFELFRAAAVEIAVVEVGLGGRLDATNVVTPVVSVITTIDFDHQALLGETIEQIAAEKAGIIKPGVPVVIGALPAGADGVITGIAGRVGADLVRAHESAVLGDITPALPGSHQRDNAVVALAVLMTLAARGFDVPDAAARYGIEHVDWPGRLEHVRSGDNEVLLDAAHNPAGARALSDYLRGIGWTDATLLFGAMGDKDVTAMLRELADVFPRIVVTTAGTPRAAPAEALAAQIASLPYSGEVDVIDDPAAALRHACAISRRVVVAGSIFLMGPLRGILR